MTATTWNPTDKSTSIALYDGNATAMMNVFTGPYQEGVRATSSKSAGVFVYEVAVSSFAEAAFCIGVAAGDPDYGVGSALSDGVAWGINGAGEIFDNTTILATYTALADGDRVQIAVDCDNGYGWVLVNGALANGGSLPLGVSNADFTSITGAVFPAVSSVYGGPSLAGRWLEEDFEYTIPSGALAWDDGIAAPTEIEDAAEAGDSVSLSGAFGITIEESIAASSPLQTKLVIYLESAAAGADDDETVPTFVGLSLATSAQIASGARGHVDAIVAEAIATSLFVGGLTIRRSSTAGATDEVTAATIASAVSQAAAAELVTSKRRVRATLVSGGVGSDAQRRDATASASSAAGSVDTVLSTRQVSELVLDAVAAASLMSISHGLAVTIESAASATSATSVRWGAHASVVDVVEAEVFVGTSSDTIPIFWVNPITAAGATWSGLPLNSFAVVGGGLYGAGGGGIHALALGQNTDVDAPRARVVWDLSSMGSMQIKRMGPAYFTGSASKPFSITAATDKGRWTYKTDPVPSRKKVNHRAAVGRGIESAHVRFSMSQQDDFELDRIVIEHDTLNRRY